MSEINIDDLLESPALLDKIIVESELMFKKQIGDYMKVLGPTCGLILIMAGYIFTQLNDEVKKLRESNVKLDKSVTIHAEVGKGLEKNYTTLERRVSAVESPLLRKSDISNSHTY